MRFQKFSEFVILVQLLIYALVQGQQGETCASKIEKLWPRQQLDMERVSLISKICYVLKNNLIQIFNELIFSSLDNGWSFSSLA